MIHDIGFLLAYKDLQTPDRRERVESAGNNLMTVRKQHVRVRKEYELAVHANVVRDRVRWRTYHRTGVLPEHAPQPLRHWEQDGFDWTAYECEDDPDHVRDFMADCDWAEVVSTSTISRKRHFSLPSQALLYVGGTVEH